MEVVRDRADNAIIICSIENVDPMGVHTGDCITVAPALTLTDKEYQRMRSASIAVLREIGVETGGSNVQFAVDPKTGRMIVIEMNPRVSRSSALASKATGFPIAKVAAKLAVGYTLDEIANDITGGATPASFEPTIDYVVTKIPRFAFEKFKGRRGTLSTAMKSVGEVMAIGRSFAESLQKALRGLEIGLMRARPGARADERQPGGDRECAGPRRRPTGCWSPPRRCARASPSSGSTRSPGSTRGSSSGWRRSSPPRSRSATRACRATPRGMRRLKAMGFSDARLARAGAALGACRARVRRRRRPTARASSMTRCKAMTGGRHRGRGARGRGTSSACGRCSSGSTAAPPSSTRRRPISTRPTRRRCSASPRTRPRSPTARKIVILGGGPNRIGQGIEFDYCCCHAAFALKEAGFETIMVNCNPETVSTDPDTVGPALFRAADRRRTCSRSSTARRRRANWSG